MTLQDLWILLKIHCLVVNLQMLLLKDSKKIRTQFTWENAAHIAYKELQHLVNNKTPKIKKESHVPNVLPSVKYTVKYL